MKILAASLLLLVALLSGKVWAETDAGLYAWIKQKLKMIDGSGASVVRGNELAMGSELGLVTLSDQKETILYSSKTSLWSPLPVSNKVIAFVQDDGIWTVDIDSRQATLQVKAKTIQAILGPLNDHVLIVAVAKEGSTYDIFLADLTTGSLSRPDDMPAGTISDADLTQCLLPRRLRNDSLVGDLNGTLNKITPYSKAGPYPAMDSLAPKLDETGARRTRLSPAWLDDNTVIYLANPS